MDTGEFVQYVPVAVPPMVDGESITAYLERTSTSVSLQAQGEAVVLSATHPIELLASFSIIHDVSPELAYHTQQQTILVYEHQNPEEQLIRPATVVIPDFAREPAFEQMHHQYEKGEWLEEAFIDLDRWWADIDYSAPVNTLQESLSRAAAAMIDSVSPAYHITLTGEQSNPYAFLVAYHLFDLAHRHVTLRYQQHTFEWEGI